MRARRGSVISVTLPSKVDITDLSAGCRLGEMVDGFRDFFFESRDSANADRNRVFYPSSMNLKEALDGVSCLSVRTGALVLRRAFSDR